MKKFLRTVLPFVGGMALGAGGLLGLQALAPSHSPPSIPPPSAAEVAPPVPPTLEFFGLPSATADEAVPGAPAPSVLRFVPMKGKCVAGFDATSTLHDFRGWTPDVTGEIRFDPARLEETAVAEIFVDARALDTGDRDRDKEMHEHLESAGYPRFKLTLTRFTPLNPSRGDGPFLLKATLEIRGKAVPVESPGTFELRPDGLLHVKGEFRVRMSQFGITPPVTAVVIRVEDEVKVWFEIWAKPERKEP
jgi:polyisoprenoid-binding protein YceI